MPINIDNLNKFLQDEDENTYAFDLKETLNDNEVILSILGEFEFKLAVDDAGNYTVSSEEDLLDPWVIEVQQYCKQGNKSLEDVLQKCTVAYETIVDEDLANELPNSSDNDSEVDFDEDLDPNILGDENIYENDQKETANSSDPNPLEIEEAKKQFKLKNAPQSAINRLMKDYILLTKQDTSQYGFSAAPINNDLFHWEVKLFGFDVQDEIYMDLIEYKNRYGMDHILMDMTFPPEYPFSPPFIRVVKPRLQFHTGHVTIGGSICMELLTPSGWMPSNSIESILIQIRVQLVVGNGRIDFDNTAPYTEQEAKQAFIRVAQFHNWM